MAGIKKGLKLRFINLSTLITLLAFVSLKLILYLQERGVFSLPSFILDQVSLLSLFIITFLIISIFLRFTVNRVYAFFDEPEEKIFYSKTYTWSFYTLGILIVLYNVGVSIDNITLFIGLLATGLAFAVRDIIFAFFSWMVLLRKKPFRIGDYISIGDDEGKVQHIGTFYVVLDKTPDLPEDFVRVPNRKFLEYSIVNYGKTNFHERIRLPLSGIPPNKDVLVAGLRSDILALLEKKEYLSILFDHKDDRLLLRVDYLSSFKDKQAKRSDVLCAIHARLGKYLAIKKD